MRKGIVTPEKNSGLKLTIPVRTRTPLEAFKLLEMGQPVDVMAGYYDHLGILEKDFQMMDKVEKLHALARAKEFMESKGMDYQKLLEAKKIYDVEEKKNQLEMLRRQLEELTNKNTINEAEAKGTGNASGAVS